MLKKIVYFGEDVNENININQAIELLGSGVVQTVFLQQKTKTIKVDSDYSVRFVFE